MDHLEDSWNWDDEEDEENAGDEDQGENSASDNEYHDNSVSKPMPKASICRKTVQTGMKFYIDLHF